VSKEIDVIQQGLRNREYDLHVLACAPEKPICVFWLFPFGGRGDRPPPFVFDLKAGKKTVDLQDYPTGKAAPGDFIGPALEFTPDGKQIASFQPSTPYHLQLHDADTGKLVKALKIESAVGVIRFSPNGKLLAAICQDGTLLILQPDLSGQIFSTQVERFAFEKYGGFPRAIAFVGDGHLAVLASYSTIELFDTKEWKSIRTFAEKTDRVNCVAASPDGKLLAAGFGLTGRSPGFVRIWNTENGELVKELK
jgi:WD40 repeat protein